MERKKEDKSWMKQSVYWTICLGICCLLFGISCYEPKEGCLDAEATNFDANADELCPNCCEYPTLSLSFLHKIATSDTTSTNLVYNDSAYTVDGTHFFKINQIRFYISDVQLIHTDGSLYTTTDSIELKIPQNSGDTSNISVPNNYILVDRNNFQDNTLGNFRKSGNFEGLQFQLGVIEPANHADPNQLSDNHPLSLQEESMHWSTDSGYIFNQIALFPDTIVTDSIVVNYGTNEWLRPVSLQGTFFIPQGFDVTLVLQINYLEWFRNINFQTDTKPEMAAKIADHVAASFSFVEVKLE